jgi:lysophospholipase L1-like esterase
VLGLLRLAWSARSPRRPALAAPDPGGVATFAAYYRALVREIAATGAVAVPMTFAIAYPGDFGAADRRKIETSFDIWLRRSGTPLEVGREIIELQNQAAVDLAEAEGLPACDVAHAVAADPRHFRDVCHLTAAGNQAVAEALAATLVPLLGDSEQEAGIPSDLARNP